MSSEATLLREFALLFGKLVSSDSPKNFCAFSRLLCSSSENTSGCVWVAVPLPLLFSWSMLLLRSQAKKELIKPLLDSTLAGSVLPEGVSCCNLCSPEPVSSLDVLISDLTIICDIKLTLIVGH